MADETTEFIIGDAAADALSQRRKRRLFNRRKRQEHELTNCENCGTPLTGAYCSTCGQHAIDYRRSLLRVLIDAADSFLNWDTKFLNSLAVLLMRPWRLTNDFNAGRRARYVHPLRLYLLASIAFFLLAKLVHLDPSDTIRLSDDNRAEIAAALGKLAAEDSPLTPEQRARIDSLRTRWSAPDASEDPAKRARFDAAMLRLPRLAEKREMKPKDLLKVDVALHDIEAMAPPPPHLPAEPGAPIPSAAPAVSVPPAPAAKRGPTIQFSTDNESKSQSPFEVWMETRVKEKVGEDGTKAKLFLETLRNNIPTMMLCCIPLFALVLKVLYFRQRRYYIEHLVYALHIHTFAYIATVVITLIGLGAQRSLPSMQVLLVVALSLAAVALVFVSIRRVYRQGWFTTTLKFLVGGVAYFVVIVFAVATTALVTLLLP